MNEKIYFLPEDSYEYSFDEITALILEGSLRKKSMIWEKELPDWVTLESHPDFTEVFEEYDRIAQEKIKQVLGTDDETVQKREMLKMLDDVSVEKQQHPEDRKSSLLKWVFIAAAIIITPVIVFSIIGLFKSREPVKTAEKAPVIEDINIDNVKFESGVMKIDEIKGIKVVKVAKAEEDKILKEILLEIKNEMKKEDEQQASASGQKETQKKEAGLFDKVSDEELDAFRSSFMKKADSKNVTATVTKESKLAQSSEELTSKQINETVKNNYSTIKSCYDKALKNNDMISGKMEITIHIMGDGSVAKVINETPKFKGTEMERCVTEQIKKKWVFPKFNGTLSTATIPFLLSAQ